MTLIPALIILGIGFDPTRALVLSQVVLSFGIPFALIPLVAIASSKRRMGEFVNPTWLKVAGWGSAARDHRHQRAADRARRDRRLSVVGG